MQYLNFPLSLLLSQEVRCAPDAERSTWINLLVYCAGQENGGIIRAAAGWTDRQWMLGAGVEKAVVQCPSPLWEWDGADLRVHGYPVEQEAASRIARETGKKGASMRWSKQSADTPNTIPNGDTNAPPNAPPIRDTNPAPDADPNGETNAKRKEKKGKEREGKGTEDLPSLSVPNEIEESYCEHMDDGVSRPWAQGFPRSEAQAVARCGTAPIPPGFAAWLWQRDSRRVVKSGADAGNAGADFYGKPIARWATYALREYQSAARFAYESDIKASRQGAISAEKKEAGGEVTYEQLGADVPEPDWDWRALALEIYEAPDLDTTWSQLNYATRTDLTREARSRGLIQKKKGAA